MVSCKTKDVKLQSTVLFHVMVSFQTLLMVQNLLLVETPRGSEYACQGTERLWHCQCEGTALSLARSSARGFHVWGFLHDALLALTLVDVSVERAD